MSRAWFSEEEMNKMTISQLRVVAEYFHVNTSGRKKEIIAAILNGWEGDDTIEDANAPMSVQVRRIYESLKEAKG